MWRRTASSRRCDSAQKTPLRWLENGSGSPVATNAMPTPEPRYSNPASSSGSVMPRSSFAIGVLAPNRNAEPSASIRGGDLSRGSGLYDSPLEGDGFELSVPRQIGNSFRASSEMGPIDRRRGGGIRAVAGLGNRSNVGGHSKSCCSPPNQATPREPRCRQGAHIAEPEVRIQLSALSADQKTLGIPPF